ncbi:YicC family protein [Salinisphaera sp. USBA-960]|nr:YicC family protein [Salifodinibacter halophilus]NNC26813.1 YicC family protein [Salifodinibacter halophilus]
MAHSMTGFARQRRESSTGVIAVEVRTVNHRHLECTPKLDNGLESLEASVRERVGQRLARGRVDVSIRLEAAAGKTDITLDRSRLETVATALEQVRDKVIDCDAPDALALLNYPGVVQRAAVDADALQDEVLAALDEALDAVRERRHSEGERLVAMVRERLTELADHTAAIRDNVPAIEQTLRDRLKRRLDALDIQTDPARLEQEVALAAQRMDVAEELDRIDSHRESIAQTLAADGAIGRRLDFWLQELMREVNTIGSKTQDHTVTAHTVEAKTLVEQMREQAQNLE